MTKNQLDARKKRVFRSINDENRLTSYEIRSLRLKVQQFFIDPRIRIE